MSFISYAQNFEDVMLWRALRHVENGTYVDVGAQDSVIDSVTKAFYEHGWRGVHIEPVPFYAERLRRDRPGDIVLQAALGETAGTLALNVIAGTGLSTAVDAYATRHHEAGFDAQPVIVPMLTLSSSLNHLSGQEVHWLKIDVEGYEKQVLLGWDSKILRPWVMVIEATIPGSAQTDYEDWESLVVNAGYQFVYFDGLNRFFVAQEHPELLAAFAAPPNVFDDVQLSGQGSWGLYRGVEKKQQARSEELLREMRTSMDAQHEELHARLKNEFEAQLLMQTDRILALEHELEDVRQDRENALATLREQDAAVLAQEREQYASTLGALHDEHAAAMAARRANYDVAVASLTDKQQVYHRENAALRLELELISARYAELHVGMAQLNDEVAAAEQRVVDAHGQIHKWWSVADQLSKELLALRGTKAWRFTQRVSAFVDSGRRLRQLPSRSVDVANTRARAAARTVVAGGLRTVLARPRTRAGLSRMLGMNPNLKQALRRLADRAGVVRAVPLNVLTTITPVMPIVSEDSVQSVEMAQRTKRIYVQLKNNRNRIR